MELQRFLDYLNQGNTVVSGSEYSLMMHKLAQAVQENIRTPRVHFYMA